MLVNGRGGPRDLAGAVKLFEKAAAQGHSGAMFALGTLHGGGHGLPTTGEPRKNGSARRPKLGHGQAQLMLGRYLANGAGDELNPEEARQWLERAAAQGVADAQHDLAELSPPQGDAERTWRSDQVAAPTA